MQADDGILTTTTTTVPVTRDHDDDGFVPVFATRGRGTTKASAAFLPPATVGIPDRGPPNTYTSLDDGSLAATQDRQEDKLRPNTGRAMADSTTIQAVVDKWFNDFYGPDAPTNPTTIRFRGLFDDGARMIDRMLADINEEQQRHEERTTQQLETMHESDMSARGTIREMVTTLRSETDDALILLRRETTEALDRLLKETTAATSVAIKLIMQPMINSIDGLTATANKLEAKVTGLSESSARATQDILVLCRHLDGGGDLAELAALARQSEQAVIGLMATTEKNAQAIRDLRQELAGCTTLKETVDDIKTRQLNRIRDNIKTVATEVMDITTKYANLDSKYSDAFDAVNTRVDDILREGIPPRRLRRLFPRRPRRRMARQCHRRRIWSPPRPHKRHDK